MAIEGLWTSEFYGLHGWENTGVLILQNGHILGGGRNHYSTGTYKTSDKDISLSVGINYHSKPRVLFGSSNKQVPLQFEGKRRGKTIEGNVHKAGSPRQTLMFRLTKRAEIT